MHRVGLDSTWLHAHVPHLHRHVVPRCHVHAAVVETHVRNARHDLREETAIRRILLLLVNCTDSSKMKQSYSWSCSTAINNFNHSNVVAVVAQTPDVVSYPGWGRQSPCPGRPVGLGLWVASDVQGSGTDVLQSAVPLHTLNRHPKRQR